MAFYFALSKLRGIPRCIFSCWDVLFAYFRPILGQTYKLHFNSILSPMQFLSMPCFRPILYLFLYSTTYLCRSSLITSIFTFTICITFSMKQYFSTKWAPLLSHLTNVYLRKNGKKTPLNPKNVLFFFIHMYTSYFFFSSIIIYCENNTCLTFTSWLEFVYNLMW